MALQMVLEGYGVTGNSGSPTNDATEIITVPTGKIWVVQSTHSKLINSAVVGNRAWKLRFKDASGNIVKEVYAASTAAGITMNVDSVPAGAPTNDSGTPTITVWYGMSEFGFPAGYTASWTDTAAIHPGLSTGTATASDATTMTVSGTPWVVNEFDGFVVTMGGSTGTVASNTNHILTINAWSPLSPVTGAYSLLGSGDTVELTLMYAIYSQVQR